MINETDLIAARATSLGITIDDHAYRYADVARCKQTVIMSNAGQLLFVLPFHIGQSPGAVEAGIRAYVTGFEQGVHAGKTDLQLAIRGLLELR